MRHPLASSPLAILLVAACGGSAPAQEPPAAPVTESAEAPAAPAPATAPAADPAAEPAPAAPGPVSKCGVGGTDRSRATTCDFVLVKGGAECCFAQMADACREAGCAVSRCDLLKSLPPQVSCRP